MTDRAHLDRLPRGARAVVAAIPDSAQGERLRALGFCEGVEVEVLHHAWLGRDPIAVRVGGVTLALRRAAARLVSLAPAAVGQPAE